MKRTTLFIVSLVMFTALIGCGGDSSSSSSSVTSSVVVNWLGVLGEGESVTWALNPGQYRLTMTSSPNGASVEWLPNNGCANASEANAYVNNCTLSTSGQVKVTNPTTFGLGPSETVTVVLSKL